MFQTGTDKVIDDLRRVVRDAEELLRATTGMAGEKVAEARAKAEASLHEVKARLAAAGADAAGYAKDAAGRADQYVRSNPWPAVGFGVAAGLLVGLLLGRRQR